jgi:ubiquinone/menaquinone biosynthesis C-methylase UbiE
LDEYGAKKAYRRKEVVKTYDEERFDNTLGKFVDGREKKSTFRGLNAAIESGLVLDIPCGTGRMANHLFENNYTVIGADISLEMLRFSRNRISDKRYDAIRCDIERLPFKDGAFDSVVCIRLMGHVPPNARIEILKEMRRVTRKWLVVAYYNSNCLKGLYRRLKMKFRKSSSQWHPTSITRLRNEVNKADLRIHAIKPIIRFIAETNIVLLSK